MPVNLRGKNFITLKDFTPEKIRKERESEEI